MGGSDWMRRTASMAVGTIASTVLSVLVGHMGGRFSTTAFLLIPIAGTIGIEAYVLIVRRGWLETPTEGPIVKALEMVIEKGGLLYEPTLSPDAIGQLTAAIEAVTPQYSPTGVYLQVDAEEVQDPQHEDLESMEEEDIWGTMPPSTASRSASTSASTASTSASTSASTAPFTITSELFKV